jgi:hypothetical protein
VNFETLKLCFLQTLTRAGRPARVRCQTPGMFFLTTGH